MLIRGNNMSPTEMQQSYSIGILSVKLVKVAHFVTYSNAMEQT